MSVRHFTAASSEKITLSLGALGFAMGPGTIAAVIRTSAAWGTGMFVVGAGATNNVGWALRLNTTGSVIFDCNNTTVGPTNNLANSEWYLIAAGKATGTVVARLHNYRFSTGTWDHRDSAGTLADSSTPITRAALGVSRADNALFFDGDLAAGGVWNVVLTDAQIESLLLFLPVVPKALWRLNQDTVAETVQDLTGGGANQSAITGTTITAVTQPVGMMNLAPPKPVPAQVFAVPRAANF